MELASNAVDSQKEKEIAISILKGEKTEKDYFVEREGEQYEDSKFKRDYYSLDHLNSKDNTVYLRYVEGSGSGFTDQFIVEDKGVGLGMPRLSGYFDLGFSTKRNTKHALGAFGLGAKSSLSTGVPYYTLETVHNGKKFKFNCYAYKVDSLVPKMNMATKTINKSVNIGTEEEPYLAYYEDTDEKNYTKIITGVKRHNRQRFVHAVKNQLLYFKGTKFLYKDEGGYEREIPFLAKVLHNSDSILISDTRQFSRPHVVIVKEEGSDFGVTYGTIDFQELEMQQFYGSLGLKCPIRVTEQDHETGQINIISEGVTVNPSRESVIWDEHTRAYIQSVIEGAQDEATKLVEQELEEEDFFKWVEKANQITSRMGSNHGSALSIISNLVETNKIRAAYPKDKSIKFDANPQRMFTGMSLRKITVQNKYNSRSGRYRTTIERDDVIGWRGFSKDKIFELDAERHNAKKDLYLCTTLGDNSQKGTFITFKVFSKEEIIEQLKERVKNSQQVLFSSLEAEADKIVSKQQKILKYLKPGLQSYSEIEVPDDFGKELDESEDGDSFTDVPAPSPAELRALNGEVVCYTFNFETFAWREDSVKLDKREPKLKELKAFKEPVIYGVKEDEPRLKMLCLMYGTKGYQDFFSLNGNKPINVLRFSKRNLKHIKNLENFIHVDKYLWSISKTSYNVGSNFVPFFTAEYIKDRLQKLNFLCNFKEFNEEVFDAYETLVSYVKSNHDEKVAHTFRRQEGNPPQTNNATYSDFRNDALKGRDFQLWLREEQRSEEEIADKSEELFDNKDIKEALVIDEGILGVLEALESYAEPIGSLFSHISLLTQKTAIDSNSSRIISEIIKNEGLEDYGLTEKQKQKIQSLN